MCGSLKHENTISKIGERVDITNVLTGKTGKLVWSGFAQQERLNWWLKQGATNGVVILADSFVEGKAEFKIPGSVVSAIGLRKDVFVKGKLIGRAGTVRIVTRAASTDFEKTVHDRWPMVLSTDNRMIQFNGPQMELFK
jgi:hypothetical protein